MAERAPEVALRAAGPLACFSRPEFSVERTSYPWITPSAARALFEAVLWKPRIRYEIREVRVLRPIRFMSIKRNELGRKIPATGLDAASRLVTDDPNVRQQRNTVALSDVAYEIRAELHLNAELTPTGPDDNHGKYVGMFNRRLDSGQQFHQPYLGLREFAAQVEPVRQDDLAITEDLDHGLMLYDFRFPTSPSNHRDWRRGEKPRPVYFDAKMRQGVVAVPSRDELLARLPEAHR